MFCRSSIASPVDTEANGDSGPLPAGRIVDGPGTSSTLEPATDDSDGAYGRPYLRVSPALSQHHARLSDRWLVGKKEGTAGLGLSAVGALGLPSDLDAFDLVCQLRPPIDTPFCCGKCHNLLPVGVSVMSFQPPTLFPLPRRLESGGIGAAAARVKSSVSGASSVSKCAKR